MAKFLLLWETDIARMPVDPKERLAGWTRLLNMVKDDLESGRVKEWGVFPGEHAGYTIVGGADQEVFLGTEKYIPYVRFETHSVLSVDQVLEGIKSFSPR